MDSSKEGHSEWERRLRKMVVERWLIYLGGIGVWTWVAIYLPTRFGNLPLNFSIAVSSPLGLGYLLLGVNLVTTLLRRHGEDEGREGEPEHPIETEVDRINVVQNFGGSVLVADSIIAAFLGVKGTGGSMLFLAYLGASITVAILSMMPIWVSNHDRRQLLLLRHVKTVFLTFSVALLTEAVALILGLAL